MYRKWASAMYVLNIVFQSFLSLLMPIGFSVLICFVATKYWSAPGWIYAPAVVVAALLGFYYMIRFVLNAMKVLDSLERSGKEAKEERAELQRRNEERLKNGKNSQH